MSGHTAHAALETGLAAISGSSGYWNTIGASGVYKTLVVPSEAALTPDVYVCIPDVEGSRHEEQQQRSVKRFRTQPIHGFVRDGSTETAMKLHDDLTRYFLIDPTLGGAVKNVRLLPGSRVAGVVEGYGEVIFPIEIEQLLSAAVEDEAPAVVNLQTNGDVETDGTIVFTGLGARSSVTAHGGTYSAALRSDSLFGGNSSGAFFPSVTVVPGTTYEARYWRNQDDADKCRLTFRIDSGNGVFTENEFVVAANNSTDGWEQSAAFQFVADGTEAQLHFLTDQFGSPILDVWYIDDVTVVEV